MKHIYKLLVYSFLWVILSNQANAQIDPTRIKIARDQWGVPHIFAPTDAEVAYGLAWAHAEDDFSTIQQVILPTKGLLGKHLGKKGAAIDYVVGLIRARETAYANYETAISDDYKAVLSGYVQGLNAYASTHPKEVLAKKLFPLSPQDGLVGFILANASFSGVDKVLTNLLSTETTKTPTTSGGSNAFAISANKTTDGKTYLAINSHQPLEGPVAWYEAHLCSEQGWNIIGGLFPGAATVLHGCNENLGWAHTVNFHDKMDVYQLEINAQNKEQYKLDGEWKLLEMKKIKLKIKGIPVPINKKAYWSEYGPVVITKKGTFALRFSGLFEVRTGEQWYRMNKANSYTEFYKALQMTAIPGGFNIVYADKRDTIFYITNGKIPFRNIKYNWKNTLPGNTSETLWTTYHPVKDLPQVVNPRSGYVFNTNNTPYNCTDPADNPNPQNYDHTMGIETFELNRSVRVGELMKQYEKISYEDFKTIKYDLQLPSQLKYSVDIAGLFLLSKEEYPELEDVITILNTWDKKATIQSQGATVFLLTYHQLRNQNNQGISITKETIVDALRQTKEHLTKYFGKVDVPLGYLQRHTRGKVSLACPGIPDVLRAMDSKPTEDGRMRAYQGESYIELVRFSKNGLPEIETVNAYGASNHPDSEHYTDQMEMFVNQKTKKMTLDKQTVLREARRVYSPR